MSEYAWQALSRVRRFPGSDPDPQLALRAREEWAMAHHLWTGATIGECPLEPPRGERLWELAVGEVAVGVGMRTAMNGLAGTWKPITVCDGSIDGGSPPNATREKHRMATTDKDLGCRRMGG